MDPKTKNGTIHDEFMKWGLKGIMIDNAIAALRPARGSAMTRTCAPCHDQGHKEGGRDVTVGNLRILKVAFCMPTI